MKEQIFHPIGHTHDCGEEYAIKDISFSAEGNFYIEGYCPKCDADIAVVFTYENVVMSAHQIDLNESIFKITVGSA